MCVCVLCSRSLSLSLSLFLAQFLCLSSLTSYSHLLVLVSYVQINECTLRHTAWTFYLNEARAVEQLANVEWIDNHGTYGKQLVWRILRDISVGEELLVSYGGF